MITRASIENGTVDRSDLSRELVEMLDNVIKIHGEFKDATKRHNAARLDLADKSHRLDLAHRAETRANPPQGATAAIKEVHRARQVAKLNSFGYVGEDMVPALEVPRNVNAAAAAKARRDVEDASVAADLARIELTAATSNLRVWTSRSEEAFGIFERALPRPSFADIHNASMAAYRPPQPKPQRMHMSRLDAMAAGRPKISPRRDATQYKPRGPMFAPTALSGPGGIDYDKGKA